MRNRMINNYKNNTIFGSILMIGIMILLVGFSYAFFVYNKTGLYTHTITGGKMSIIYNETTGNNITINNAYPLTDEEALTKGLEFEFTITGYNESDKNIYYAIEMDYGEDVADKERFLDRDMKLTLYENDEEVFENEIFSNLDNQDIHYGMINYGTSSESPVTNNYKLRIWINDNVIISDTLSDDLSTWSEADFMWFEENYVDVIYKMEADDFSSTLLSYYGVSIYTTSEFANRYANFKVNVKADLTYDDVGFITYDANGGEFTPEKTSLTTGRVTTQKPVMRTEVTSQTSSNLNGKVTQIDNEIEYEYKGFLGWSSTPNGEVEYKAGDYYSGKGKILYAVYSETVNKMVEFWPDELYSIKSDITNVYFISESQGNIDVKYSDAEYKWDLSYDENSNVKGWIETDENDIKSLYIASEGTTYLTSGYGLFASWHSLTNISFDNVDTSIVEDMSYMFGSVECDGYVSPVRYNIENNGVKKNNNKAMPLLVSASGLSIAYLDLSMFNTINVISMRCLFADATLLTEIYLNNFKTNNVTDMSGMFSKCWNLEKIDIDNFDTSNVTDMSYMFYYLESVKTIGPSNTYNVNLEYFNTSSVKNMSHMFADCSSLTKLDISNFDTSRVTDMSGMFYGCSALRSIGPSNEFDLNLLNINTSNVVDMSWMFTYCSKCIIIDLTNFNTINVVNMPQMFSNCSNVIIIDVSSFIVNKINTISYMFSKCSNLKTIYCNDDWNNGNITNAVSMFQNCSSLIGATSYNWVYTGIERANPDTGYFTRKEI